MAKIKRDSVILAMMASIILISMTGMLWAEMEKIDINTATEQELTQLKKIGAKTAARIVEYRNSNGLFKTPEDIMNVKGIGPSVWGLNKDRITVGSPTASAVKTAASDLVSKAAPKPSSVNEKTSELANEITSKMTGKSGALETRVMELEKKIINLEKKISELEKKKK